MIIYKILMWYYIGCGVVLVITFYAGRIYERVTYDMMLMRKMSQGF